MVGSLLERSPINSGMVAGAFSAPAALEEANAARTIPSARPCRMRDTPQRAMVALPRRSFVAQPVGFDHPAERALLVSLLEGARVFLAPLAPGGDGFSPTAFVGVFAWPEVLAGQLR